MEPESGGGAKGPLAGGTPRERAWLRVVALARWPLAFVAAALLVLVAFARSCPSFSERREATREAIEAAGRAAGGIAERLRTGRITTSFVAALPELLPGEAILELAAFEATEAIARTDSRSVLFDLVPLGSTVSEIRVPVTYRYHVRLSDAWRLEARNRACLVRAPRLRPTLPPAIHTDRMEKRSEAGWLRFDASDRMAELERSMTPTFSGWAADPRHVSLVREPCRLRLAEFVRSWLLREDHWRSDRFSSVTVVFEDEAAGPPDRPPTLRGESVSPPAPSSR
jgi:hypothetical protein